MRRPSRVDGKAPEIISNVCTFKGKVVEMIYKKAEEIESKGGYCSIERAIHCLLLELDNIKQSQKPCHMSHI